MIDVFFNRVTMRACGEPLRAIYYVDALRVRVPSHFVLRAGITLGTEEAWDGKKPTLLRCSQVSAARAAGAHRMPDEYHDKVMDEELRRRNLGDMRQRCCSGRRLRL